MELRRGKRTAAQDFLIYKPFVVVFVKFRFEARIGNIVRTSPFPNISNHLVTSRNSFACRKSANWRYAPVRILEKIGFCDVRRLITPGKVFSLATRGRKARSLFP